MTRPGPGPGGSTPASAASSRSNPDQVRAALREAWSELLGVAVVAPISNFYSEGGTSLTAALLLAKMHGHGAGARLAELLACKTFAEQLDLFTAGRADPGDTRSGGLFPAQEFRLARIARQVKASGTAVAEPVTLALEITGDVDHDLLIESMVELVRRHDVLSTGFVNHEGQITPARTAMADSWRPETIDLSGYSAEEAQARIWKLIAETANHGLAFDTTALILGAVAIVRPGVSIAALVVDHLVCDGQSLDILFGDLAEIYSAKADGRPPSLPSLQIPAQDSLEPERYSADDWPDLAAKWRELLDGYPAPPAFNLTGPIGGRDYSLTVPSPTAVARLTLPAGAATKLKATYRQLGLPPLAIMLAATYLAAHIISGARDICMINVRSRRNAVGATHVVNDFAEPSIIRIRHPGTSCPCELTLAEVAAMAASSYAAASELEIPFDVIREYASEAGNSMSRSLIGSAMRAIAPDGPGPAADGALPWLWCNYAKSGPRSRHMGDAVATILDQPAPGAIDLPNMRVTIEDNGNELKMEITAPQKLYGSTVISEFGSALGCVLRRFGQSPGGCISASGPAPCMATVHLRQP